MKKILSSITVLVGLLAISGGAQATIVGSMHDLSGLEGNDSQEICVFCHTPHGSDTSAPAPLWNKVLPDAGSFQTYDELGTATLDGNIDLGAAGISLACLSCHDGTTAIDLVLNAPTTVQGEYRYNAAGQTITAGGVLLGDIAGAPVTPVPVLGKDLRDDHPVGVEYAGGGLAWGDTDVQTLANDKLFNDPIVSTSGAMWVGEVGGDGLPLFNGTGSAILDGPTVECATCHDPHKTVHGSFLRAANTASALCLTCHTK